MADAAAAEQPKARGWRWRVHAPRFWVTSSPLRVRRPTSVLLLILSVVGLGLISLVAPGPTDLDEPVLEFLKALPGVAGWAWRIFYTAMAAWTVILVVAAAARRRRSVLVDQLLAGALAVLLALLASLLAGTSAADGLRSLFNPGPPATYLAVRLAIVTGVVVVTSPHLTLPVRWVGRTIIVLGAIAGAALGTALPIGISAGFLVGVLAAQVVSLVRGSPAGRPTADEVSRELGELGIDAGGLVDAPAQPLGAALFQARSVAGDPISVKVLGQDAWDAQLVTSTWLALVRRGEAPRFSGGRFTQVEHEAMVSLLAERAGVPVVPVLAIGTTGAGDAILVTAWEDTSLADLADGGLGELDPVPVLDGCWDALNGLHACRIAHGDLNGYRVLISDGGRIRLGELGAARTSADETDLAMDRSRLLVATALVAGPEAAVAAAHRALDTQGLTEVLPLLQPAALDRVARKDLKDQDWTLSDLTARAVEVTGAEPPALQQLRRVTWRSAGTVALIGIIAYTLISMFAGVDFSEVVSEISQANWALVAVALVISAVIPTVQAVGTVASSIEPVRYGPVVALQYAIQFLALVLPASAARVALEVRFFQRFGLAAAAAISISVIDSFMGFLVQVTLILLIVLSGLPGVAPGTTTTTTTSTTTADSGLGVGAIALLLVIVGLLITYFVPSVRSRLKANVARWRAALMAQAEAGKRAAQVLRKPVHVVVILGANLAVQTMYAITLGVCLAAFGDSADLSQLILVNTFVSLFAGFMPVPGGMGVAEAGYIAGLQAIGIDSAVAISTAIMFRLVTFYLPPAWGSIGMGWLRRNSYV